MVPLEVFVKVTLLEKEFPVELWAKNTVPPPASVSVTFPCHVSADEFAKVQFPVPESTRETVDWNTDPPFPVLAFEFFFTAFTVPEKVVPENLMMLAVTFRFAAMVPLVNVDVLPLADS